MPGAVQRIPRSLHGVPHHHVIDALRRDPGPLDRRPGRGRAEVDGRKGGQGPSGEAVAALAADPLGHGRARPGDDDDFRKSVAGHGIAPWS